MAPEPPPALAVTYREKVRPFIDLVDELRASGLDRDVTLPSVVVIGDQSAGKSSCLEAISGVQLPRGSGIVTRCPLELRLKKSPDPESGWRGYIHFEDKGETRWELDSPEDVGEAVKKAQNQLAGESLCISPRLITLDVESPDIPDLTLIDLPGIARVPVGGQPDDIGDQTKALIREYIQMDETIILAVVPCNVDIATTEALKMAKEVDPDGSRTLGVLTKPDLIDRGTENMTVDIVNNRKYALKKGYTIIKCRGQVDIENKVSLSDAMDKEEMFFQKHEHFKILYEEKKTGTKTLAGKLTTELVEQIKKSIPGLKEDIREKLRDTERQLLLLGDGIPEDPSSKMRFLVELLNGFTVDLEKLTNGEQVRNKMSVKQQKQVWLIGDVRDAYRDFAAELEGLLPGEGNLEDIEESIQTNRGRELPGFLPYSVCEAFIQKHMENFQEPASDCLLRVNQKVETVLSLLTTHWFQAYSQLNMAIKEKINDLRLAQERKAQEVIKQLFEMENLVFTQDAIFHSALKRLEEEAQSIKKGTNRNSGDQEDLRTDQQKESEEMLQYIKAYFEVSIRRLSDTVPMAIRLQLLTNFTEEVKYQITLMIAQPDTLELLHEDPDTTEQRTVLTEKRRRLTKANQKLAKF
ncbi:PREDICTED: interferon-induced GTP-binding protein Mx1-like [Branchiostoma belcheri]|uniref:Interferon-induced GTP-binding protein Mx1-like n=1 Tax=Branchiostoma belcheri TaxID=7741 RepID=A0A6P4YGE6_BRABE|nr:PREDICTED: interferon-induced GTP-binding protein Mx1-like [Branchiostoma belcheri]